MLRIHAQTSVAGAKSYYTEALAREDYYSQGQETVGQWRGHSCERLGLSGRVTKDEFASLCDNVNPASGERLTERTKSNRRVGYDFSFSAPKSVSVVYGQTQDPRILNAFQNAVTTTMEELERDTETRARASNRRVTTGNLVWGEFIHTTARPVDGEPDPQLHAHCFTFNATFDEHEERWKAAEFGGIKRDARYFEAAFHSRFAQGLADNGYDIRRTEKGWELDGIPDSVIEKFSRRTQQIEEAAARRGISDPDLKGALGAQTRSKKAKEFTTEELRLLWDKRLTADEREAIRQAGQCLHDTPRTDGISPDGALAYAKEHEFARASVVPERRVLETALRRSVGEVSVAEVHEAADRAGLLRRSIDGRAMASTKDVLAEERAMLAFARNGRGRCAPMAWEEEVADPKLNAGQRAAVEHIWRSHDRVMVIRGGAGTGKTTLMQETVRGLREHGCEIVPLAPTAEASRGVLRREGFASADTVAKFLADERMQEESRGRLLWIDEAGLLGTRDLGRVFTTADSLGCRVVLCGDTKQHAAVARGDALRLLETEAGIKPAEVTQIVRQKGEYREAIDAIAKGDVAGGFERLDAMGAIREVNGEERHLQLASDYLSAVRAGKTAIAVSPTHAEGERATEVIRDGLRREGRIRGDDVAIGRLRRVDWTEAEKGDSTRYVPGQVIQLHRSSGKAHAGDRYRVTASDNGPMLEADGLPRFPLAAVPAQHFDVYEPEILPVALGDTLRITRNGMSADGSHRLNNGATYRLKGFADNGDLVLDNGWTVDREYGHLAHGYVTTSHASQGRTVDCVFVAQGAESFATSSREQFYVSVSRARESVTVYTDDRDGLLESIDRSGERMSATELMRPQAEELATSRWDRASAHAVRLQQWASQARDYAGHQLVATKNRFDEWRTAQPEPLPELAAEPNR